MWDAWAYWTDACQRTILFWDVLRQRSERYHEHAAKAAPHVLKFEHKLLMDGRKLPLDGRKLPRTMNYALARVAPPDSIQIDPLKRPFVIVDLRADHGPGIEVETYFVPKKLNGRSPLSGKRIQTARRS